MSVVLQYTYQNSKDMSELNRQIYDLAERTKSKFLECADKETTDEISLKVQQEGDLAAQRYAQLTLKTTDSEAKLSLLATYDLAHASVTVSAALVNGIEQSNITLEGDQIYLKGDTIIGNGFKLTGDHIVANTITATQIKTATITANEIAGNTITAAEIKSGTITANEIAGNTITAAEIKSGTITANEIASHTITAAEISTSYVYAGSISADQITSGYISASRIGAGNLDIGSSTLTIGGVVIGTIANSLSVPNLVTPGETYLQGGTRIIAGTSSLEPNAVIFDANDEVLRTSASSRRWKHDIKPIEDNDLDPKRLFEIPVVQFKYNDGYLRKEDQRYGKSVPGFIAEDVNEIYPIACDLDKEGKPRDWNMRYIIPPMLSLIQDLNKRVKCLEDKQ